MFLYLNLIKYLLLTLTVLTVTYVYPIGADTQSIDFKRASSDYSLKFPADHGKHNGFRVEWWYLTSNLSSEKFGELGIQWTLFKNQLAPQSKEKSWGLNSFWMGHSAITTQKNHFFEERFARKNMRSAGVTLSPFNAWIDNWSASGDDELKKLKIYSDGEKFSYSLEFKTKYSPIPQGENGFSLKSASGNASHYYSQPFYIVEGWVEIDGLKEKVKGLGWLDREWSSDLLSESQVGWDWFSIHLEDGSKLMLFQVREKNGSKFVSGSWINKDGCKESISAKKVTIKKLKSKLYKWGEIPIRWHVHIPEKELDVKISPLNQNSFMETLIPYWEGPVKVSGSKEGVGYLEMTGYSK